MRSKVKGFDLGRSLALHTNLLYHETVNVNGKTYYCVGSWWGNTLNNMVCLPSKGEESDSVPGGVM